MGLKHAWVALAAAGLIAAAPAAAQVRAGYLAANPIDTYKILPPAPVAGTARYEADRKVFKDTRKFEGGPRWTMAQGDDNSGAILKDLSCAIGVNLTRDNAPTLASMMGRVALDSGRLTNLPKDIYKRQRPFLIDEGAVCIAKPDSYDYPSGHNTWSWVVGLIMAELAPDRATEILVRARAFGESRLVCGVHNLSAVEAGRMNGSIIVAALHGEEAFRKDLDVARAEVAAARKAGPAPDAATCAAEAELTSKSPY